MVSAAKVLLDRAVVANPKKTKKKKAIFERQICRYCTTHTPYKDSQKKAGLPKGVELACQIPPGQEILVATETIYLP